MADQPSVLVMVADTGDMDMGMDMDTAMDMAIAVGDVVLCGLVLHRRRCSPSAPG
jgi:hypothetical protein